MSASARRALKITLRAASTTRGFAFTTKSPYGRTAAYRRICDFQGYSRHDKHKPLFSIEPLPIAPRPIRNPFIQNLVTRQLRNFTLSGLHSAEQRQSEDVRDPPSEQGRSDAKSSEQDSKGSAESESDSDGNESKDGQENTNDSKSKKEEPAPPPPHGDKTPFQVFMDTMKTEFQASKEWNESTKAISDGTNSFFNSEAVRKAQQASGAATSKTAEAIKGTGKVLGQGAAWTWETPVVKGVRSGVSATGRGVEKATRPVRETKAYKAAMDVIDDGSSSKYGGWVEKEERRKRRELREAQEGRGPGSKIPEKMEEDPK